MNFTLLASSERKEGVWVFEAEGCPIIEFTHIGIREFTHIGKLGI